MSIFINAAKYGIILGTGLGLGDKLNTYIVENNQSDFTKYQFVRGKIYKFEDLETGKVTYRKFLGSRCDRWSNSNLEPNKTIITAEPQDLHKNREQKDAFMEIPEEGESTNLSVPLFFGEKNNPGHPIVLAHYFINPNEEVTKADTVPNTKGFWDAISRKAQLEKEIGPNVFHDVRKNRDTTLGAYERYLDRAYQTTIGKENKPNVKITPIDEKEYAKVKDTNKK